MSAPAPDAGSSESSSGYEDGLGRRVLAFDRETGDMRERLRLRPELRVFARQLEARLPAIAALEDERFARPRGLETDAGGRLSVLSEYVVGRRLCDVLDSAADQGIIAGLDAGLGLLLEVLPALSVLHDAGLTHGALAPGRIMVTPAGQIVLLDSIYGEALERLQLTRRRLWVELRLAFPSSDRAPRFDKAADLTQASLAAAALIVGRPLRDDEYPDGLAMLRQEIIEIASIRGSRTFADGLDRFFSAALPLPTRKKFLTSADEAVIDLRKLLRKEVGIPTCRTAMIEFFQQVDTAEREHGTPSQIEAARHEAERVAAERAEAERIEAELQALAREKAERAERGRLAAERKARDEAERKAREEAERKARDEAERKARDEAERKARDEAERKAREEAERQAREEAKRQAREEAERKAREEAERKTREEAERKAREEAERKAREEAKRQAREEAERKAREEAERKAREEAERKAREEAKRQAREDAERKAREEAERKAREEAERKAREEAKRQAREDAERKAREEAERKVREEAERKAREEAKRKAREEAERKAREEAERKAREEAERKAREEAEARARIEKARLDAERTERERIEAERQERERAQQEARERIERARVEAERAERDRIEHERLDRERAEQAAREQLEREAQARAEREAKEREAAAAAAQQPSGGWLVAPDRAQLFEPVEEPAPAPAAQAYPIYTPPADTETWMPEPGPEPDIEIAPVAAAPPSAIKLQAPGPSAAPIRVKNESVHASAPARAENRREPAELFAAGAYEPFSMPRDGQQIPWKLIAGGVVLIVATFALAEAFLPSGSPTPTVGKTAAAEVKKSPPPPVLPPGKGQITITTEPAGVRILVDGKFVGASPLTLDTVAAGRHVVTLQASGGTIKRTVRVEAGKALSIDIPVFSGFAAISAPFIVEVAENGRNLGTSDGQIILGPGHHQLHLENRDLDYHETRGIDIEPGEATQLALDPRGTANINAAPWAEVYIDGEKAGDTPLANVPIRLGVREIVFKNPQFPDRKIVTTIKGGASATTISVDFAKDK